jgi:hypothetical protein
MKPLAICSIVKNEATYLKEWVAFHRLVGVSRFVTYDDRSSDTSQLTAALSATDVTVVPYEAGWDVPENDGEPNPAWPWHQSTQCRALTHFARHYGGDYWCAFIDPDEFLFHTGIDHLPTALELYEKYPAVVVNWLIFGSNGHYTRPPLTIEAYTRRAQLGQPDPYGRHVKPIVNMTHLPRWGVNGSHCPLFDEGVAVRQDGGANPWSMTPAAPGPDGFRVHHYYHRSYEEATAKLSREYSKFPGYPGVDRLRVHDRNELPDTTILRFLPKLKEAMRNG